MKPVETLGPDAANTIVYHIGGFSSLLRLSQAPKTAPTVIIYYETRESISNVNGHFSWATVSIYLHHFVRTRNDARSFFLCMEAGRAFNRPIWSGIEPVDFRSRSATIREWLTECETSHPNCRRSPKPDVQLATRILEVQEFETDHYSVNLVSTKEIDLCSRPYIVLTHVWGGKEVPCKTTKSNIAKYFDCGIDFDSLPKTFQDAVRLTVAIGFRYLWIDSLCIIQDDKEDWQRESAKMAAIYGAGTITLSATSAENSDGGCGLSPKIQSVTRFCSTDPRRPDFAVKEKDIILRHPSNTITGQLRHEPVYKRAWILQEKILSRRVLHATYSQFVWKCNVITESEDGIAYNQKTYLPPDKAWRTFYRGFPQEMRDGVHEEQDVFEFERRWWIYATDYSKRSLTHTSDQYAALAGIVQFHQDISGDRPVVGLWERHLIIHLSWEVRRDTREHKTRLFEPADRRPSWTWMTFTHGSVELSPYFQWSYLTKNESTPESLGMVYQAQVLSTDIRWSSEPLTSDPSGSTVSIRGIMRRMRKPKPVRTAMYSPLCLDPGMSDERGENGEYDTIALFAYGLRPGLTNQSPVVTTVYLVVKAVEEKNAGTYMRIGSMRLTVDFDLYSGREYRPEGVEMDITLV
ncbi:hypothetical protein COCC4DRAFT_198535 [Bipolaris maydis ATCC 48331]|uniref:Heterokaryon incompatibility domain-containing protein n=2 Tax=Cochliobolus heterostrophus TaxID=5016 RepID=M2UGG7_COCH5|nr:uncharacterized protein COCC4DRAFT_198535 [Bipolaris maydis ATCC 48331]EMD87073.1 hypothetical protein COCHEDRAFT_1197925 [Bipolaris maydis C5]KAJ5021609.1 heterokaryon incompatibility protein-domain-containing protein [Bipolaris maydis]ENI03934.1 hypothetical protein COCC4DRAFT_198535 [Bipolaris maydis ATCC 48331]KAJ5055752.1 heterokaryon incompatibility protein-domain-containing protein [Bipolaris maydis]KAJ6204388.1 heterokaryon incompatibility protein-domain-containing protein [Bipolari